jgi:hypothetical protein
MKQPSPNEPGPLHATANAHPSTPALPHERARGDRDLVRHAHPADRDRRARGLTAPRCLRQPRQRAGRGRLGRRQRRHVPEVPHRLHVDRRWRSGVARVGLRNRRVARHGADKLRAVHVHGHGTRQQRRRRDAAIGALRRVHTGTSAELADARLGRRQRQRQRRGCDHARPARRRAPDGLRRRVSLGRRVPTRSSPAARPRP